MKTKPKQRKVALSPLTPEQRHSKRQLKRMKGRAAILSIQQLDGDSYRVWGGDAPHVIHVVDGAPVCDCKGWQGALDHNCSHVVKYRLTFGDLKKSITP